MEELQFDETLLGLTSFVGKPNKSSCKKRILKENLQKLQQFRDSVVSEFPDTLRIVFSQHAFTYFMDKVSRFELESVHISFDENVEKGMVRLLNE